MAEVVIKKEYYEDDNVKSETPYVDGQKHGVEKWYYQNGSLKFEIPYLDGTIQGVIKEYYLSGNLKSETFFINNKAEGIARYYQNEKNAESNNRIRKLVPYKSDKINGSIRIYDKKGEIKQTVKYMNGKITDKEVDRLRKIINGKRKSLPMTKVSVCFDENEMEYIRKEYKIKKRGELNKIIVSRLFDDEKVIFEKISKNKYKKSGITLFFYPNEYKKLFDDFKESNIEHISSYIRAKLMKNIDIVSVYKQKYKIIRKSRSKEK